MWRSRSPRRMVKCGYASTTAICTSQPIHSVPVTSLDWEMTWEDWRRLQHGQNHEGVVGPVGHTTSPFRSAAVMVGGLVWTTGTVAVHGPNQHEGGGISHSALEPGSRALQQNRPWSGCQCVANLQRYNI
ncbi:hypothetical protein EOD39_3219 [Acipenser ruthenus]|uniref:Uncharacterized protein n=1 Tax=Acipenser ruthenus TaxID=7906 RepID=A0A444UPG2_ACIRT|nr:hypothetical protein EOD39_3219 [Acipenser ruthenus]